ncbi:MAG: hypothetical protein IKM51_00960 [Oscillospiraceae bacterium]|nr:hypothetical protein [Oscillospiraceae bacterium]
MKTIASKKDNATPDETLLALIYKYCGLRKVSKEDLAVAMYFSRSTLYNRLRAPSTFTFEELKRLFKILRFSDADMTRYMKLLMREITSLDMVS